MMMMIAVDFHIIVQSLLRYILAQIGIMTISLQMVRIITQETDMQVSLHHITWAQVQVVDMMIDIVTEKVLHGKANLIVQNGQGLFLRLAGFTGIKEVVGQTLLLRIVVSVRMKMVSILPTIELTEMLDLITI